MPNYVFTTKIITVFITDAIANFFIIERNNGFIEAKKKAMLEI